jgi:hypothetical protein
MVLFVAHLQRQNTTRLPVSTAAAFRKTPARWGRALELSTLFHTHTAPLLRTTMAQAGDSDGKVIQRLNDNESAFAALTPDAAAAQMPRLSAPLVGAGARAGGVSAQGVVRLRAGRPLSAPTDGIHPLTNLEPGAPP